MWRGDAIEILRMRIIAVMVLGILLAGCESMYPDDGIPRIRSQRDVDAYNATVSNEGDKLVCNRERPLGSNIPQWVCMTVAQRDRLAEQAREDIVGSGLR